MHTSPTLRWLLCGLVVTALSTPLLPFTASTALAQSGEEEAEQAPYRIGLFNLSDPPKESAKVTPQLADLLERANGVTLDTDMFQAATDALELGVEELRSQEDRAKNKARVAEALRKAKLDAVIMVDVYKDGRNVQLIVVGARGEELHESKNALKKRGVLTEAQGKELLRAAFGDAIPALKAQRERQVEERAREKARAEREEREAREAAEAAKGNDPGDTRDPDAPKKRPGRSGTAGPLPTSVTLGIGAYLGARALRFGVDTVQIDQNNGLVGAGAKVRAFKGLSGDKLRVGLDADLAWAPYGSTVKGVTGADGQDQKLSGMMLRGGGTAQLAYALASSFALGLHAGVESFSMIQDPNLLYTGHRYIWAKVGLDLILIPSDTFTLALHGSALPILSARTSGDSYGVGDGGFGFEGGALLSVRITDLVGVMANYRYTSLSTTYVDANGADTGNTSTDVTHNGLIALSLSF